MVTDAIRAITGCSVAINVSRRVKTTISAVTKIDLSPLFHNIIHRQYYTSCIIAQPEPLTFVSSLKLWAFDLV